MVPLARAKGLELCPLTNHGERGVSFNCVHPVDSCFSSISFESSQSWRDVGCDKDCEVYSVSGKVVCAPLDDGIFSSKAFIYGESNSCGDPTTLFPVGGVSTVPYDPVSKKYNFQFRVGGAYFFFTHISEMFIYQLTILSKLYKRMLSGKKTYSLPPAHPSCKMEVSVFTKISEMTRNDTGARVDEISSTLGISRDTVLSMLPRLPMVCVFVRNGVSYLSDVTKIKYTMWANGSVRTLGEIWSIWCSTRNLILDRSIDLELLRNFFFANGRPCVSIDVRGAKFKMKGCIVRERMPYSVADVIFDELPETYF